MSEETKTTVNSVGIGICGLLGVAFVILKLCEVIGWSWWWVTAPFWGPVAIVLLVFLGILVFCGIVTIIQMFLK